MLGVPRHLRSTHVPGRRAHHGLTAVPRVLRAHAHRTVRAEALTMFEPADEQYRTCAECGADCPPEPFETNSGIQIAFSCPEHGVHTVVDPFEGSR